MSTTSTTIGAGYRTSDRSDVETLGLVQAPLHVGEQLVDARPDA